MQRLVDTAAGLCGIPTTVRASRKYLLTNTPVEIPFHHEVQRLARRGALAGVVSRARFYDVGVPEGYHAAVADFPPRA